VAFSPVHVADKVIEGVTCIRLDVSVVACHSDEEGAEPEIPRQLVDNDEN
jgi:hypothetical protein